MHVGRTANAITRTSDEALQDVVRNRIVDEVPPQSYHETDAPLPFKYATGKDMIRAAVLPYATGEPRTYAVYVLECLQSSSRPATAMLQEVSGTSIEKYRNAGSARRVIYVGVARNVVERLDQHLNRPGREGAYFTAMYPPVRILQIGWFNGQRRAEQAERFTATLLRDRFPEDFVAQPG